MSQGIDLQRFFRWINGDRQRAKVARSRNGFLIASDELETRRLLTLNVWIDDTNAVQISANDDLSQDLRLTFDGFTNTYTIVSFNSASNYFIVSDTSSGLTVTKTDYSGPGNPATLTIVQNPGVVRSIDMTTGDGPDNVNVGHSPARVSVSTGGSSDQISHESGAESSVLIIDGGAGDDAVTTNYFFAGVFNVIQSVYGNESDSGLAIDTSIGVNAPSNFINVRAFGVESVSNLMLSPGSNLSVTVNGVSGFQNGGFLDRTALESLSFSPIVNNRTMDVFGYETNDDIQLFQGTNGSNFFVGMTGPRLPLTNFYNMTPGLGLLRLRTLGGDDVVKAASGVEDLTRILVDGGSGDDFLSADATLIGGAGNDTLQGGLGNDSLDGGDGDDMFLISPGTDTMVGGPGFDIVKLEGATAAPNFYSVEQNEGVPAVVQVNAIVTNLALSDMDLISVQGSTGSDMLFVTGNSTTPLRILATLDLGNDIVDSNLASQFQWVSAYGEGGEDYFVSGPGTDYFYGGDDYDLFDAMYASRDSFDYFDGGSGANDLYVEGSAFGNNVISAIASGFLVRNTNGTGQTTALNLGSVFVDSAGSGVILNASDDDNVIRTFDSTSDLLPPLALNEILVTGMPGNIRVIGVEPSTFLEIHGRGGNDTFLSLGNSGVRIDFFGESGDDRLIATAESTLAYFTGGAGIDSVEVTATLGDDVVVLTESAAGESVVINGIEVAQIVQADRLAIDLLDGQDTLAILSVGAGTGLLSYEFSGGAGDDALQLLIFPAIPGSSFLLSGGAGNDLIYIGVQGAASVIASGGSGDDLIQSVTAGSLIQGDDGNDMLMGSTGVDTVSGGDGNDTILAGQGDDFISGGAGQDQIHWSIGEGNDQVDGGTGEDSLIVTGDLLAANDFSLNPQFWFPNLFDVIIAATVISGGEIENVQLVGGSAGDTFAVGDLSLTSITSVDIAFGDDDSSDNVSILGSTGNDFVIISGTEETLVSGLPWVVRIMGAQFSATTLVDGILFDGNMGEDTIITAANLTNPVLVTILGGAGSDDIRINSPALGDNPDRITVDISSDVFSDVIQVRNGRNMVIGGDTDILLVIGSENDDQIDIVPDGGGRVNISLLPPGFSSSNDLTEFTGVVHVDALGGNDVVRMLAELRSTIWGGDGDDQIEVGPAGGLAYGGSGHDRFIGGVGNDTFYGGGGNDYAFGDDGDDLLYGEDGEDMLEGGLGLDALYGGADADLLLPGKNGTPFPEIVDGGSGLDKIRFELNAVSGIIGRTLGVLNVGEFGGTGEETAFNATNAENLLVYVDSTVIGSTGYDLTIQDISGSQVNFVNVAFMDEADSNTLALQGTIAADVIDADYVLPPGGSPEAQVLMPWGTVWAYKPGSLIPNDTLLIQGRSGDDVIKVGDALSQGAFGWNIQLEGDEGNDYLSADATLTGGDGNDTLLGGSGNDSLDGGLGDDVFLLSGGLDTFIGGGGFDVIHVAGSQVASNLFTVNQSIGFPVSIQVNTELHSVDATDIEQISVQGGSGRDEVFVTGENADPIDILAVLGAGNDLIVTAGNAAPNQIVFAYGEAGNDDFIAGVGFNYFYGGDDYDIFVVSPNGFDSENWFDGGTGFNELVVDTPPAGTTTVTAIPSGFYVTNSAYTGETTALNIGNLMINGSGGGIVINGSNNDDTIRTFDSGSDLVPPPSPGTLLIAGLGADIYINNVAVGQPISIHGQGGNDTFQALGNAGSFLTFHGDSGDDLLQVTQESVYVSFEGGAGYDRTSLQGTSLSDIILVDSVSPTTLSLSLNGVSAGDLTGTESLYVNALGGGDQITSGVSEFTFDLFDFEFEGGSGHDLIDLQPGGGAFGRYTLSGGDGDDALFGSINATSQLLRGGLGNDRIEAAGAALVFGDEGNDTLIGSDGNDTMSGGDGQDQLFGNAGDDYLYGDAGDDMLDGAEGLDNLFGGADSDLLIPGTDNSLFSEVVDGGSGLDQVRFEFNGNNAFVARTAGFLNVGEFGTSTPPTNFNATDVEDLLIFANSTVPGSTGIDVTIHDLTGTDVNFIRVNFTDPNDENRLVIQGTAASDIIDASTIVPVGSEPMAQVLIPWGTVWAFTPGALAPANTLEIQGLEGDDVIKADDILNQGAFAWNIVLNGGLGNDFLSADATLIGGAGNDTLLGGLGDDSLDGGAGDDVFLLSGGLDTFVGGSGFDRVFVDLPPGIFNGVSILQDALQPVSIMVNSNVHDVEMNDIDQIVVHGSDGNDSLFVSGNSTSPIDVLALLGTGNDFIGTYGASPDQVVVAYGQGGNDTMQSGPGDDQFYGGDDFDSFIMSSNSFDSIDWFDGGTGFNSLLVAGPGIGIIVIDTIPSGFEVSNLMFSGMTTALNIGQLTVDVNGAGVDLSGSNGDDTIRTFDSDSDLIPPLNAGELLIAGLSAEVLLTGVTPSSIVSVNGQGGNDTFQSLGNAGAFLSFFGNSGDDTFVITNESSNAIFVGGDGLDLVSVTGTVGNDALSFEDSGFGALAVSYSGILKGEVIQAESLTVNGLAGNDLIEMPFDPSLTGIANVLIYGGDGLDLIELDGTKSGSFVVYGGEGDDLITGPDGTATFIVYGGGGNDTIQAGTAAIMAYGEAGNDHLVGSVANDTLDGGAGDDNLRGGPGYDLISGGADQDFVYWGPGDGSDIYDGGTGEDTLMVDGNKLGLANDFSLQPKFQYADQYSMAINGNLIEGGEVERISMVGGNAIDTYSIGDLSTTSVTLVDLDFGSDSVADTVFVLGTMNNDTVLLTGTNGNAAITGLPWLIRAKNILANGNTLVDGFSIDGHYGDDWLRSGIVSSSPMLVTIQGSQGLDLIEVNTTPMGDNANSVTVYADSDVFADRILLTNGRNLVYGGANDVIEVIGTENDDAMSLSGNVEPGRVVFNVNGQSSSNDLSNFAGVLHVDSRGGNDSVLLSNYAIRSSVLGGLGNDVLDASGLTASVSLYGGSGNDSLRGGLAADYIEGGEGNDNLIGNLGDDSIFGGEGSDLVFWHTGDGNDLVDGGTGDDRLTFSATGQSKSKVTLTPATSTTPSTAPGIGMGNANLILAAMAGFGSVTGGSIESVLLDGGDGCDLFGIGNLQTTDVRVVDVRINDPEGEAVVSTYATNLPDVITVTADAPGQIGVNGLAVPVRIFGSVPNATAIVVHAGFGGDMIEVAPLAEAQAIIVIDGGAGNDTITGGSIIIGGPGNNYLVGSDGPNTIVGGTGSDTIYGLGGDDKLFGDAEVLNIDILGPDCQYISNLIILPTATGAPDLIDGGEGNDFINGNIGPDTLIGGNGDDAIGAHVYNGVYFPEPGNDLIDAGEGNNCVFSGEGNDTVTAGNGDNRIVLGEGNDTATTGDGNNSVFGGAGNDTVTTGAGNDLVALGAGDDTATLGYGNDLAWGEDGNDFIIGQYGNDTLYGGNGNDILWGGIKATQPLKRGQKHAPIEPLDGNDVLAGENGFDQLDGGNGDNIMDAGADYIRETMIGSGGWDTAYIHKDEGKFQDVLKNHSKRYTLIPYGSMPVAVVPATPTDCTSPIIVNVPNPLSGAQGKPTPKKVLPKSTVTRMLRGR